MVWGLEALSLKMRTRLIIIAGWMGEREQEEMREQGGARMKKKMMGSYVSLVSRITKF